jgi:hypothetical protein
VGSFFLVVFEVFCFVNCGESLGIMFCTLFDHSGLSVNFTSVVNCLFTCMAGYPLLIYPNSSVISSTMPGFLRGFNYISILKWGTGNFGKQLSEDRCGNDGLLAERHVSLYAFATFSGWSLSNYYGRGSFEIV